MNPIQPAKRAVELGLKWPRFMYQQAQEDGMDGVVFGLEETRKAALSEVSRGFVRHVHNPGRSIWDEDWDILVIIDACRVDLAREVAERGTDHGVIGHPANVDTFWSLGSKSSDWLRRTFTEEYRDEIERTAYVTGNPFTSEADPDSDASIVMEAHRTGTADLMRENVARTGRPNMAVEPAIIDEVWKSHWDDDVSTIPARPITDRAIATWRERPDHVDRMIVHYMQPHGPFINYPHLGDYGDADDFGMGFGDLWGEKAGKTVSEETIWEAYRDNLEYVLEDVDLLLENMAADDVVITADHGNAVGELGFYGHPWDIILPEIRRVPWIRTTGRDTNSYEPAEEAAGETVDSDVEDRLADLGYM